MTKRWLLGAVLGATLFLPACKQAAPAPVDAGAVAAVPMPLSAGAGSAEKAGSWAVVLLSPETRDEAEAALPDLAAGAARWVDAAPDFPRVVDSATIEGLKPGYHVVVLGFCGARDTAARVTAWVKLEAPKAYFRWVAPQPEACPRQHGRESVFARPEKLWAAVTADSDAGTRLAVVSGAPQAVMECSVRSTAVQLRRGATLLDERVFEGQCLGACTPEAKAHGEATVKQIEADIARGEASESQLDCAFTACQPSQVTAVEVWDRLGPVVWVFNTVIGPHDMPRDEGHVFGPGCRDRMSYAVSNDVQPGFAAPVLARTPGNSWRNFAIAAEGDEAQPYARFVWKEPACNWVVERVDGE